MRLVRTISANSRKLSKQNSYVNSRAGSQVTSFDESGPDEICTDFLSQAILKQLVPFLTSERRGLLRLFNKVTLRHATGIISFRDGPTESSIGHFTKKYAEIGGFESHGHPGKFSMLRSIFKDKRRIQPTLIRDLRIVKPQKLQGQSDIFHRCRIMRLCIDSSSHATSLALRAQRDCLTHLILRRSTFKELVLPGRSLLERETSPLTAGAPALKTLIVDDCTILRVARCDGLKLTNISLQSTALDGEWVTELIGRSLQRLELVNVAEPETLDLGECRLLRQLDMRYCMIRNVILPPVIFESIRIDEFYGCLRKLSISKACRTRRLVLSWRGDISTWNTLIEYALLEHLELQNSSGQLNINNKQLRTLKLIACCFELIKLTAPRLQELIVDCERIGDIVIPGERPFIMLRTLRLINAVVPTLRSVVAQLTAAPFLENLECDNVELDGKVLSGPDGHRRLKRVALDNCLIVGKVSLRVGSADG